MALAPGGDIPFEDDSQLSFPTYRSRMEIAHDIPAYETFVERFVPVLFESFDRSASVSVSLPDLFVALALSAYLSGGAIESEFLSYIGLENEDELAASLPRAVSFFLPSSSTLFTSFATTRRWVSFWKR